MNTDYIEIDMEQMVVYSKGEVIAKVKTLQTGELIVTSNNGDAQRRFCTSNDRAYFFSEAGSTWQRGDHSKRNGPGDKKQQDGKVTCRCLSKRLTPST